MASEHDLRSPDFLRHMILDSLRANIVTARNRGAFIVALDHGTWRDTIFPQYKWRRKQARAKRDEDGVDWSIVNDVVGEIRTALRLHFPFTVVDVEGAEADDIIGVAARVCEKPLHIISGDKDFQQLQRGAVTQFSPTRAQDIICPNWFSFLKEQVLRGDNTDDIPSVLSADDVFVEGIRQRPVTKKAYEDWMEWWDPDDSEPFLRRYEDGSMMGWVRMRADKVLSTDQLRKHISRNQSLIDLSETPPNLQREITKQLQTPPEGDLDTTMRYLASKRLSKLLNNVNDFGVCS